MGSDLFNALSGFALASIIHAGVAINYSIMQEKPTSILTLQDCQSKVLNPDQKKFCCETYKELKCK